MVMKGLLARLEAKPGKEEEVAEFLKQALPMAKEEKLTVDWLAFRIDKKTFGIFDTAEGEEGRQAHLNGKIAHALFEKADELLKHEPEIEKIDILASKSS